MLSELKFFLKNSKSFSRVTKSAFFFGKKSCENLIFVRNVVHVILFRAPLGTRAPLSLDPIILL